MAKKKAKKKDNKLWMAKAFKKETEGALHRETGTPEGETIPASKLEVKEGDSAKTKRRKNLAKIGRKFGGGKKKK